MTTSEEPVLEARLLAHLRHRLGAWPPTGEIEIVGCQLRDKPEWDGVVRPVIGLRAESGIVLSVPPARVEEVRALAAFGYDALATRIGALFDRPDAHLAEGDFRPLSSLVDLEPLGEWVETSDPRLPDWLRPFNGGVLIVTDEHDRYAAGAALKRHDEFASEVAVGTEPEYRGRGYARRLVATAARAVVEAGATVVYEHALDNAASSAVAAASGFDERNWRALHLGWEE